MDKDEKNEFSAYKLKMRQEMDLDMKELLSEKRIREWYRYHSGKVYVSFSGGKDSTVLLHLVRRFYPDVPAVFVDTGLEYPEIREFVKTFDNVVWLKPKMPFKKVLEIYGYPVISKKTAHLLEYMQNPKETNKASRTLIMTGIREDGVESKQFKLAEKWKRLIDAPFKISDRCCDIMKKYPIKKYEKESERFSYVGLMADESLMRSASYAENGCNAYKLTRPQSRPIMFWKENDIWDYINKYNLPYSDIYNKGVNRTGCMFCMFGIMFDEKGNNRFQKMAITHPKQYKYCMETLGMKEVLEYIGIPCEPENLLFKPGEICNR